MYSPCCGPPTRVSNQCICRKHFRRSGRLTSLTSRTLPNKKTLQEQENHDSKDNLGSASLQQRSGECCCINFDGSSQGSTLSILLVVVFPRNKGKYPRQIHRTKASGSKQTLTKPVLSKKAQNILYTSSLTSPLRLGRTTGCPGEQCCFFYSVLSAPLPQLEESLPSNWKRAHDCHPHTFRQQSTWSVLLRADFVLTKHPWPLYYKTPSLSILVILGL